jgi:hypothetical protein
MRASSDPGDARKTFSTWDRLVLVPVELVPALKAAIIVIPFCLLAGLRIERLLEQPHDLRFLFAA